MDMTQERWAVTCAYLKEVFGREDAHLATLMKRAVAAGLPDIAVSPETGRFLAVLASMAAEGAGGRSPMGIEVGTLGGYSGIWLARGLGANGRLITIELEKKHADFARAEFDQAGVGKNVEIRLGKGIDVLGTLARDLPPGSVDLVFLDAIKSEYGEYLRLVRPLLRRGGLLIADNALAAGYWIGDAPGTNPNRDAMDAFNRRMAAEAEFDAACVPVGNGVLVARKRA